MTDDVLTILLLFALLQIKHTLADFFMQTQRMLSNRSVYANFGRVQHSGIHAAFSFIVALIAGLPLTVAMAFFVIDAVLHGRAMALKTKVTGARLALINWRTN